MEDYITFLNNVLGQCFCPEHFYRKKWIFEAFQNGKTVAEVVEDINIHYSDLLAEYDCPNERGF